MGGGTGRGWEAMKMAVYAAQVDRVDQCVARLLATVRALGQEANTLVVFLSDNGGCAEFLLEEPGKPWELYNMDEDRTELNDLADREPQRVKELAKLYEAWAERCGVLPWPIRAGESVLRTRGRHIHLSYHKGRQFYP